jgi:hypothetical protein
MHIHAVRHADRHVDTERRDTFVNALSRRSSATGHPSAWSPGVYGDAFWRSGPVWARKASTVSPSHSIGSRFKIVTVTAWWWWSSTID